MRKIRSLGVKLRSRHCRKSFLKDADRLARFEREAKLLASLNHPNIAAIYGLEGLIREEIMMSLEEKQ